MVALLSPSLARDELRPPSDVAAAMDPVPDADVVRILLALGREVSRAAHGSAPTTDQWFRESLDAAIHSRIHRSRLLL